MQQPYWQSAGQNVLPNMHITLTDLAKLKKLFVSPVIILEEPEMYDKKCHTQGENTTVCVHNFMNKAAIGATMACNSRMCLDCIRR